MNSDKILVKDGGFATQLSVHVGNIIDGDPLWSARFNKTNPDSVINTHLDFLNAGADIILTNTYQASVEGYTKYFNINEDQSVELIRKTVQLAHVAKEKYLNQKRHQGTEKKDAPMIIASIGPYGAHLHDGSEYNGSYIDNVPSEIIRKWHRVRINAVLEAGVDGLAIETIPCRIEAEIIIDLLFDEHLDVKFWISFQCKGVRTRVNV